MLVQAAHTLEVWLTRPRRFLEIAVAAAILAAGLHVLMDPAGITNSDIFRFETTYSAAEFRSIIRGWTDQGRRAFVWHYTIDTLFPVAYGLLLSALFARSLDPRGRGKRTPKEALLLFLPLFAGVCDWIENAIDLAAYFRLDTLTDDFLFWGATISRAKWAAIPVSLLFTAAEFLKRKVAPNR